MHRLNNIFFCLVSLLFFGGPVCAEDVEQVAVQLFLAESATGSPNPLQNSGGEGPYICQPTDKDQPRVPERTDNGKHACQRQWRVNFLVFAKKDDSKLINTYADGWKGRSVSFPLADEFLPYTYTMAQTPEGTEYIEVHIGSYSSIDAEFTDVLFHIRQMTSKGII